MSEYKFKVKTVMLIDDNEIDNFINERIIRNNQFAENVLIYTNAKSALEYLKRCDSSDDSVYEHCPKYIFLDIKMPVTDGWDFLQELGKLKMSPKCKVIILTASVNPEDISRANGFRRVKSYLLKPLNYHLLDSL